MATNKKVDNSISETVNQVGSSKPKKVLGDLASVASKKPTAKEKNEVTWEIPLTPEAAADAARWSASKAVYDKVEARLENTKNNFIPYALRKIVERLFDSKVKPSNPLVVLNDESGRLDSKFRVLMTDRFKNRLPEVPAGEDAAEFYADTLVKLGLHPQDAKNFVENELDLSPQIEFKTPRELLEGRYGENREWLESSPESKAAGQKMIDLLLWDGEGDVPPALSESEKKLVIQTSNSVKFKAGLYNRLTNYCRSVDQILAVFSVIQPTIYPANNDFAASESAAGKLEREVRAAAEIMGKYSS